MAVTPTTSAFDGHGMLKQPPELPPLARATEDAYVRRYTESFDRGGLAGLRVMVYQHSAVGRDLLTRILERAWRPSGDVPDGARRFVPIDTENITDEQLDRFGGCLPPLPKRAAGRSTPVVSTDGDSDRPLVTAVLPLAESSPAGGACAFCPAIS